MKHGKLAVSLTAAAVMATFAPAFAQNTSTYTTSSSPDQLRNEGLNSDSSTSMRNTDDNAPPVVQQEQEQDATRGHDQPLPSGTYRTDSSSSGSGSPGNDPATPSQSGRQPAPY